MRVAGRFEVVVEIGEVKAERIRLGNIRVIKFFLDGVEVFDYRKGTWDMDLSKKVNLDGKAYLIVALEDCTEGLYLKLFDSDITRTEMALTFVENQRIPPRKVVKSIKQGIKRSLVVLDLDAVAA